MGAARRFYHKAARAEKRYLASGFFAHYKHRKHKPVFSKTSWEEILWDKTLFDIRPAIATRWYVESAGRVEFKALAG